MTTYTDTELWAIISAIYYDNNEVVTVPTDRSRGHVRESVTGLQAEILHTETVDLVENVGHPDDVFVTPRAVFDHTTYTDLGTVRRRLDDLVDEGLLEYHGDIVSNPDGGSRLYIPAALDHEELVRRLHERDGRPVPEALRRTDRTHVTPGQFDHVADGRFRWESDETVEIDVSEPEGDLSIQSAVEDQLTRHGLTADLNNFVYKLRDRAGLT